MTIRFDHTIVGVRDKHATAAYLSELLGVPSAVPDGPDRGFSWDDPDGHVLEPITRPATTRAGSRVRSGS